MAAPVLQFKRGNLAALPGLQAGEPGFVTDTYDLFVGIDSTTGNNKFVGSHRYWTKETTTTGSAVKVVEGTDNGSSYIELKAPASLGANETYILPATATNAGFLKVDGSGNMSWDVNPGSSGTTEIANINIDGGTDIGAGIVDADLFIVDDGASGTNRKTAASRIKDYVLGGSAGATFTAINVTGISTVAFAKATTLTVGAGATVTGALDVDGGANIASGLTVTGGATVNSLQVSDLTDNRVVIAGTSGELEDSGNLTFDGSTLGVTGAATVSTTLGVTGESTLASATVSDLTDNRVVIAGTAGSLEDSGNLTFDGSTLGVTGTVNATSFTGSGAGLSAGTTPVTTLDIDGAADIGAAIVDADEFIIDDGGTGTNKKTDASRIKDYVLGGGQGANFSAINVSGIATATFTKATTLTVGAGATVTGALDVDGGANIASGLTVTGGATVGGAADFNGGVTANTLVVEDLTDNRVVIAGSGGELEDSGNLTFNGSELGVTGTVNASSTVTASAFHTGAEGSAIRVTSNTISGPATMTLDPAGVGDNTGKVVIAGDFQVDGTTTTVNSTTVSIDDKNFLIATGSADDSVADGAGITVDSGDGDKTWNFEATGDNWGSSENINLASGKVLKVNNSEVLSGTALSTNVVVDVASVNIDGATDIGAALADADLFLVDDGAGGTNRKTAASRIKDYVLGGGQGANFSAINVSGIATVTFADATTLKVGAGATVTGALDVDGGGNIAGQLTLANPPRDAAGGVIPQVGAIKASGHAGLVTAFKFSGNGIDTYTVSGGIADIVTTGVAATTFVTNETVTATQGQTAFTFAAGYTNGFMDCYLNGSRLITGTDYVQTNSNTVTLASGATVGDELEMVAFKSLGDIVNIDSVNVIDNLTVSGVSTLTGLVDANGGVTATTVKVEDLTDNRVVIAGTGGELEDSGNLTFDGSTLGVTGAATVSTTLTVAGETTLASAIVSDLTDNRVVIAGTSGALEDSGNLTFDGSTLGVTGAVTASGTVTGSQFTGSGAGLSAGTTPISTLDIDGGTATATLADADLFIVDDGANGTNRKVTYETLSESILGGSGGATFAAVNVTGIGTFGGIIDGNGGANISGGAGLVASTAQVTDLTSGRVVLAGTNGELEDSNNLRFNGSTLIVGGAGSYSGNLTVSGDLTVEGTTTQINTTNTTIEDTLLELQKVDGGALSSDTNKDVGVVMNYYSGSAKKAAIYWDDSVGRIAVASEATETAGVMGSVTYGGLEVGSLFLNDCAGASQVISCSGTTRSLENITIDGGSF